MQQVLAVARIAMGAVCVIGADLRIRYWNAELARLAGIPEAAAIGRACAEVFGETGRCCDAMSRALAGEPAEPFEVHIRDLVLMAAPLSLRSPGQDAVVLSLFPRRQPGPQAAQQPIGRPPLTAREIEVLRLLIDGWETDRIAATLRITRTTVRNHVQRLLRKLGAHSKLEAVAIATRLGLRGHE